MADIELFIGKSSTEGERKRKARLENKERRMLLEDKNTNDGGQVADVCPPENRDKRLENRGGEKRPNVHPNPLWGI